MELDDIVLQSTIGMNREEFLRSCELIRNPKGINKDICPVCGGKVNIGVFGDMFCENYWKKTCVWHRHKDGTNYWSKPQEIMDAQYETLKAKKDLDVHERKMLDFLEKGRTTKGR